MSESSDGADRGRGGSSGASPSVGAACSHVDARRSAVNAAWNAAWEREHARLLLLPILERAGCDPAPLEAVLAALVDGRGMDGPATVHWLLGCHPALPAGERPLDAWWRAPDRAGSLAAAPSSTKA